MSSKPSGWWNLKILIPVLIFMMLAGAFAIWRIPLGIRVNNELAKIRAAGLPTSGAEVNLWHPVLDSQNGAPIMKQAFALDRTFPDRRSYSIVNGDFLYRTNIWTNGTADLIAAYVQMNAPALAKAREALTNPAFGYVPDYSFGPETLLPHLSKLQVLGRAAALQAVLEAEQGRANDWPQSVDFDLRLASTLDNEPIPISHFVHNAIIGMAVNSTQRCLSHASPDDDQCRKLQEAFANAGRTNTLPQALIGERALAIPEFRPSASLIISLNSNNGRRRGPTSFSGKPTGVVWCSGFFERHLNAYLQTMDQEIALARLPFPEARAAAREYDSVGDHAFKQFDPMSGRFLTSISEVITKEATVHAQINLTVTALAVERFQHARGRLPENLQELTPQFLDAVPADPFDGAPLRYHQLPHGYVIYSIGEDGHDDDGREPPEYRKSSDQTSYDITFIVEHELPH